MRRLQRRPSMPARHSDNYKRRLLTAPSQEHLQGLQQKIRYVGSPKHKELPHLFGLEPFRGVRGDTTLCDRDAGFDSAAMQAIPAIINRGLAAGLVGTNDMIWGVADDGWIFEARPTNRSQAEYHGYPVRPSEAIARPVYERFARWAQQYGSCTDRQAAANCRQLYEFR